MADQTLWMTRSSTAYVDGRMIALDWDNRPRGGACGVLVFNIEGISASAVRQHAEASARHWFGPEWTVSLGEPGRWGMFGRANDPDECEFRRDDDSRESVVFVAQWAPAELALFGVPPA